MYVLENISGLAVLRFGAEHLGVFAAPLDRDAGTVVPTTAAEALRATGAIAVLDGPMFELCGGATGANQVERYRSAPCARMLYAQRDIERLVVGPGSPETSDRGVVISVHGGSVAWHPARQRDEVGGEVVVQLFPWLVSGGRPLRMADTTSNNTAQWRAAVGQMNSGELAFAVGAHTLQSFANKLASAGFVNAGYTDGGGSTRIQLQDGTAVGAGENRRVASWLTVGGRDGGGSGGGRVLVAASIAVLVYLMARK